MRNISILLMMSLTVCTVLHPLPTPIISRGPSLSPNLVPGGESPRYSRFCDRVSQPPFASHLPRPGPLCHPSDDRYPSSPPFPATYSHGRTPREHEKRHACAVCGRAFNRPSSLAIHENTHTGAQRTWESSDLLFSLRLTSVPD